MSRMRSLTTLASDDRGSGSVLALALVGAILTIAAGAMAVVGVGAARARAAAAADLAALAGADVALGRAAGVPCDVARDVARANRAALARCDQQGVVVTVTVSEPYLGWEATVSARAGPAGG